ncbi:MAG: exodeoxyribonuclease V subunit gamma, partial [Deltaproteobacteria bacterium]|nr:exodeoxyribonuclease V subunit gamma [Deltaproteobacteria bacterium]
IRTWVRESGVRWGIDGSYRKHLKLPGFQEHTWRFGLDRLLLGYALPEKSDADLFAGVLPHGAVEGEEVRVLGAFTAFVERLFARTAALRRPRSPVDWSLVLTDMLDEFFSVDPDSEDMFNQLRDTLTEGGLAGFAAAAAFKDEVPLEIVEAHLGGRLNSQAATHGFIRGGVTFCTLLPMRSIPFKVVYVLGMNDGDYPRVDQRPGFDLLGLKRRLGDRSKRHEDRFLFLETLLSARQRLFISYQGRSLQDNSRMSPSVLVSELCDYIRQGWGAEALQRVVCEHPLQPFSPAYFDGSGPLFSYSAQNCLAVKQPAAAPHANRPFVEAPLPFQTAEELQQFDIEQLKHFFKNPAEYFMHHRLQARLRLNAALEPQAREP